MLFKKKFILWFHEIGIKDVPKVGGKNASLGEMYQHLTSKGINIPNGFAVTAQAYFYLLRKAKIDRRIREVLADLDTKNMKNLMEHGERVRHLILGAEFPPELKSQILAAYRRLEQQYGNRVDVAVRSSASRKPF